ncbi:unnamed protein product, partial [Amoebophrya sp. A25]
WCSVINDLYILLAPLGVPCPGATSSMYPDDPVVVWCWVSDAGSDQLKAARRLRRVM